jgi:hypothetical protein
MDQYSFLNTAHSAYFAELYDQYLIDPKLVEPRNMGAWSHLLLHLEEARSFRVPLGGFMALILWVVVLDL